MLLEEDCLTESIHRAAGYTLDQTWIQFFGILLLTFFPKHDNKNPTEQLLFALATTWTLCAVRDICREFARSDRQMEAVQDQADQDELRNYDLVKIKNWRQ
jgi:hypothetical protein